MRIFCLISSLLIAFSSVAQLPAKGESEFVYSYDWTGEISIHARGWGFGVFYAKQKDYKTRLQFGLDIMNMKHRKETKVVNESFADSRSFVYGKLNSLILIHPTVGIRKNVYRKKRDRGIEIGYLGRFGPSFGLLKPYYVTVCQAAGSFGCLPEEVAYNPEQHNDAIIMGRASGARGWGEIKPRIGAYAKLGLYFDFAKEIDNNTALEVGMQLDAFPNRMEILAVEKNSFLYPTVYLSFIFGKKYF